jgi:hypothetical protein
MLGLDSAAFARLQARVNTKDRVRIRTRSHRWLIITRPNLTTTQVESPATDPFDLRSVAVVQVRGNSAGTGAMVGAGVGFVPGFLAGTLLAGFCLDFGGGGCSDPSIGERLGVGVAVGIATASIGALLGAATGAIPRWKTVYRGERVPTRSARVLLGPHSQGGFTLGASVLF